MTVVDRVSEPCGVERCLIDWYRQALRNRTADNLGLRRPASRAQRRLAWRTVRDWVAAWIVRDLADGVTPSPRDVRVWQKITAHIDRTFAADQDRR